MKAKVTVLCENSVGVPFDVVGEHGFACFVETGRGNYLFDTGQGLGLVRNALALKKDLASVEAAMISHGHYGHTGGLPAFLKIRGPVGVYGHPGMFVERTWSKGDTSYDIGIPCRRGYLEALGADFRLSSEMVEVGEGVFLTGEMPRLNSFEKGDPCMTAFLPGGERVQPDPVNDDLSLIIDSSEGLILVLGCAHAGMVNISDKNLL